MPKSGLRTTSSGDQHSVLRGDCDEAHFVLHQSRHLSAGDHRRRRSGRCGCGRSVQSRLGLPRSGDLLQHHIHGSKWPLSQRGGLPAVHRQVSSRRIGARPDASSPVSLRRVEYLAPACNKSAGRWPRCVLELVSGRRRARRIAGVPADQYLTPSSSSRCQAMSAPRASRERAERRAADDLALR